MWVLEPNLASSLLVAFTAAALGSLHCVAMCGPIRLLSGTTIAARIAYQSGRGAAYLFLGGAAGGLGWTLPSWALVVLLITAIALSIMPGNLPWARFRAALLAAASASPFFLGLASGLLPCGMLHWWVAAAAATADPRHGALLLGTLWLGTLPSLELSRWALTKPLRKFKGRFPKAVTIAFVFLALIPILLRSHSGDLESKESPSCHSEPKSKTSSNHH